MSQQIIKMQLELNYYAEENRKLKVQVDAMRKQRQEQVDMHLEENRKVIFDTQNSKDKIEKLKVELYILKKKLRKNEKF